MFSLSSSYPKPSHTTNCVKHVCLLETICMFYKVTRPGPFHFAQSIIFVISPFHLPEKGPKKAHSEAIGIPVCLRKIQYNA